MARRFGFSLGLVAGALVLSSCAPSPSSYDRQVLDELRTDAEDMAFIATCLSDLGWDARLVNGAIEVEVPDEQAQQYESDSLDCLRETGIDPDAPLTEKQYRAAYGWSKELAECLEGAGWPVPPTPSFEVFRDTYDEDPWLPWSFVEGKDLGRAGELCPILNQP